MRSLTMSVYAHARCGFEAVPQIGSFTHSATDGQRTSAERRANTEATRSSNGGRSYAALGAADSSVAKETAIAAGSRIERLVTVLGTVLGRRLPSTCRGRCCDNAAKSERSGCPDAGGSPVEPTVDRKRRRSAQNVRPCCGATHSRAVVGPNNAIDVDRRLRHASDACPIVWT